MRMNDYETRWSGLFCLCLHWAVVLALTCFLFGEMVLRLFVTVSFICCCGGHSLTKDDVDEGTGHYGSHSVSRFFGWLVHLTIVRSVDAFVSLHMFR